VYTLPRTLDKDFERSKIFYMERVSDSQGFLLVSFGDPARLSEEPLSL